MTKRAMLEALIAKEQDPAQLKALQDELIRVIEADAVEKAKVEMAAQAKAEAARLAQQEAGQAAAMSAFNRAMVGSSGLQFPDILPPDYKGFNVRKTLDFFKTQEARQKFPGIHQRAIADPVATGKTILMFADMLRRAMDPNAAMLAKAALQENTDSEGGYLVPTEQRMEVLAYCREQSVALRDATVVPMTSDSMTLPRELTKVTVQFTDEEAEATETEPTFDQVTLTAKRLDGYTVSSNELLQDAANPGGVVGMLMSQFVEAVAMKIDSAVFMGTGSPVSGIYLSTGYSEVFGTGSSNFSELLEVNLRNLIAKIPTCRLTGAKWYAHRSPVWTYLYGLKDTAGRNLFIQSLNQGVLHTFYGFPLELVDAGVAASAAATAMLLFGNLKGFWIGERLSNISLFVDPYTRSTKYQTIFLMFTRWAFAHAQPGYYGRLVTAA